MYKWKIMIKLFYLYSMMPLLIHIIAYTVYSANVAFSLYYKNNNLWQNSEIFVFIYSISIYECTIIILIN